MRGKVDDLFRVPRKIIKSSVYDFPDEGLLVGDLGMGERNLWPL